MPLARYFLCVGAALLALLIVADTFLPKSPIVERPDPRHPTIRLYSDEKWPERVVFDTGVRTSVAAAPATTEHDLAARAVVTDQATSAREPTADVERSIKTRDAFAELTPTETPPSPSADAAKQIKAQPLRKSARRHPPHMHLVWRQPTHGWYGNRYWW